MFSKYTDSYIFLRNFQNADSQSPQLSLPVLNLKRVRGREKFEPGNIPGLQEVFHHLPGSERALPQHSLSLPLPERQRQKTLMASELCIKVGKFLGRFFLGRGDPKPKYTSLSVSKLSSMCTMLGCRRPRMISISRCRFLSSFSERPNFGMNFRATTYQR